MYSIKRIMTRVFFLFSFFLSIQYHSNFIYKNKNYSVNMKVVRCSFLILMNLVTVRIVDFIVNAFILA